MTTAITLRAEGKLRFMEMTAGDSGNVFNPETVAAYHEAIESLETDREAGAVVLYSAHEKFFSAGLDLKFIKEKGIPWINEHFVPAADAMMMRLAALDLPVICAINGHAYGAGALLALCADFRFMNAEQGNYCFPEVDLGIPFSSGMEKLILDLPDQGALRELVFTGRAIQGEEAANMQIVQAAVPAADLLKVATEKAQLLAEKKRENYAMLKRQLKSTFYA